jgi:hypothetical protein
MKNAEHPSKKITFVLPVALIERLRAQAQAHRRSLVGELVWAVEQYLKQQERQQD